VLLPDHAIRYLQNRVTKEGQHAGDEIAARRLAEELGYLPLALEQAAAFIIALRWSFDQYCQCFGEARSELLNHQVEGGTVYPTSVAKTWSATLELLNPLARTLLYIAAWFAPESIPRRIFAADKALLSEALGTKISKRPLGGARGWASYFTNFFWRSDKADVSDLALDQALAELDRFSLIHLTGETASVHRLIQAVQQDSLTNEECARWLEWAVRLFSASVPGSPDDVRTWSIWLTLRPHAEALIKHTLSDTEPLMRRSLAINEASFGPDHRNLNNLGPIAPAKPTGLRTPNR
jgi:hypothetical protein